MISARMWPTCPGSRSTLQAFVGVASVVMPEDPGWSPFMVRRRVHLVPSPAIVTKLSSTQFCATMLLFGRVSVNATDDSSMPSRMTSWQVSVKVAAPPLIEPPLKKSPITVFSVTAAISLSSATAKFVVFPDHQQPDRLVNRAPLILTAIPVLSSKPTSLIELCQHFLSTYDSSTPAVVHRSTSPPIQALLRYSSPSAPPLASLSPCNFAPVPQFET